MEAVREWLLTAPKESVTSSNNKDQVSLNRTRNVPSGQPQVDNSDNVSIQEADTLSKRDKLMIQRFEEQTNFLREEEIRDIKSTFIATLPYRYPFYDTNDHQARLDECIEIAPKWMLFKDQRFNHTSSSEGYNSDLAKRKCAFFLKVIAKNIAFDVGYWDIIRHGTPTKNIGGLCYCPCSKWFNDWTENYCPNVKTDNPT